MKHSTHRARVEAAISDPTRVFANPAAVIDDAELDRDEKRAILESWLKDDELMSTAAAENMGGGEQSHIREIKLALVQLTRGTADAH